MNMAQILKNNGSTEKVGWKNLCVCDPDMQGANLFVYPHLWQFRWISDADTPKLSYTCDTLDVFATQM